MTTLGIDAGTTRFKTAILNAGGEPQSLTNRMGQTFTPSVVYFGDAGPLVGTEADNAALTSNPVVLIQTPAIVTASLVAGYAVNLAVPIKRLAKRYLGLRYVSVGVHSAGSITAGIYRDHQTNDAGFDADDGWS